MEMWEEFLGKMIRVTKTDGYVKFGKLTGIEEHFIFLKYQDGRTVTVMKDEIALMEEGKE